MDEGDTRKEGEGRNVCGCVFGSPQTRHFGPFGRTDCLNLTAALITVTS